MEFRSNVPLAHYTTFRIGGPAKLYAEVSDASELSLGYERAAKDHLPVYVFSGGSNILFSDEGFPGLILRLTDGGFRILDAGLVSVGAGRKLNELVTECCKSGLSGLERLAGIPGSVGGAIRGNAGAFGADTGSVVASVKALDTRTGMVREYQREECVFGYRESLFKRHPELVVLSAEFRLGTGADPKALLWKAESVRREREEKHSQDAFSAGSFFMNPVVLDERLREEFRRDSGKEPKDERLPAGWIIDQVGLRGRIIGHAKVSEQHPNYIVNTGGATAAEVLTLVSIVKQKVRDELDIQLQAEVQLVGFGHESAKHRRKPIENQPADESWPPLGT
ncbi:MAG: UDP-N-acetylmuramate dehydrogenase [Candidatus Moranbacteria bacterium]|nr:UDP-N-acetylmuramate dehydrogenase [Candidatus Moranbacteria bacterium]